MPDFYYSIDTNQLIFIDKSHLFENPSQSGMWDIAIYSIDNENALCVLTFLLEKFSNERDTFKNRKHFWIELQDFLKWDVKGLFYTLAPNLKWLVEKKTDKWNVSSTEIEKLKMLLEIK